MSIPPIRKRLVAVVAVSVLILGAIITTAPRAQAEGGATRWQPTADKPLALHWVLGDPLNVNNAKQMGLRDFQGNPLPEPDVYDIDGEFNTKKTVDYLHAKGKKVICYFDAGAYETYRTDTYKFDEISPQIWGAPDVGWEGSYWLDIRRVDELKPIMQARMQMCKDKGFDAIDPDEIDSWEHVTGFEDVYYNGHKDITYEDQLIYNKALAQWAHEMDMPIAQKGDLIQTRDLVDHFDFTMNEECFQFGECLKVYDPIQQQFYPGLQLYTQANKAVFVAEYKSYKTAKWNDICTISKNNHFNTTRFKLGMPNNGGRMPCTTDTVWPSNVTIFGLLDAAGLRNLYPITQKHDHIATATN